MISNAITGTTDPRLFQKEVYHAALTVLDTSDEIQSEWGGYTVTPPHMATALEEAVCIMAGPVASSIENGEDIKSLEDFGTESEGDRRDLDELFGKRGLLPAKRKELSVAPLEQSKELISENWTTVLKIAAVLLEKKRIEGWEISKIVEDAARD